MKLALYNVRYCDGSYAHSTARKRYRTALSNTYCWCECTLLCTSIVQYVNNAIGGERCSRVVAASGRVGRVGNSGVGGGTRVGDGGHTGGEEALRGAQNLLRPARFAQVAAARAEPARVPPAVRPFGVHDPDAALAVKVLAERLHSTAPREHMLESGSNLQYCNRGAAAHGAEHFDRHVLVEEAEDDAVVLVAEEAYLADDRRVVEERLRGHVLLPFLQQLTQRVESLRAETRRDETRRLVHRGTSTTSCSRRAALHRVLNVRLDTWRSIRVLSVAECSGPLNRCEDECSALTKCVVNAYALRAN